MKKSIKNNLKIIIAIVITAIICISSTVLATGLLSNQVLYKDGKTVEQALNELYALKEKEGFNVYNCIDTVEKSSQDSYDLKKCILKVDETEKMIYIKIEANVLTQDRNTSYKFDVSNLNINQIVQWHYFDFASLSNFHSYTPSLNNNKLEIGADTNWGYDTKNNYNYMVVIMYQ